MPPTPWDRYATAMPSIADAVGRTPLVRLNRITRGLFSEAARRDAADRARMLTS